MDELQRLRDRVAYLEDLLGLRLERPVAFGRSKENWRLLSLFMKHAGRVLPRDYLFALLYGHLPEADQPHDLRTIDQRVCRLNRDLATHRVRIRPDRGVGYYLPKVDSDLLRVILERGVVPRSADCGGNLHPPQDQTKKSVPGYAA